MTIFIIILSFLSLYTVVKSCTSAGNDPYSSGSLVACCSGTTQTLKNWNPSNPSIEKKGIKTYLFYRQLVLSLYFKHTPSPSPSSGLVKGLALIPNDHNCGDVAALGSSWFYNWGTTASDCASNGVLNLNKFIFLNNFLITERVCANDLGIRQPWLC